MKSSLFPDDKVLFLENPKDSIKTLLELINSIKLQDTKLIQKLVVFLFTNNELSEKEIRKTIFLREELRWRRSRMGRTLSPP